MLRERLNFIVVVVLLAVACCGVLFIRHLKKPSVLDVKLLQFPMNVGGWSGKDLPVDSRVYDILATDKVLLREYSNVKNEKIWFAVVYGEQKRQSFHPPEYCYLGSGNAELLDKRRIAIKLDEKSFMDVNELTFLLGDKKQLVLYWFSAGDKMTPSYYKQQIYFVLNQLRLGGAGGTLVRISTSLEDGKDSALRRSEDFIREAVKILPSYL
ncbi:MAG: exosortase C-terminal domain/associated protein EpsI [Candidatus Omnitrophota bacterium]